MSEKERPDWLPEDNRELTRGELDELSELARRPPTAEEQALIAEIEAIRAGLREERPTND